MGAGDVVALLAGAGRLPPAVARGIKARGLRLVGIRVTEEADDLAHVADRVYDLPFGGLAQLLTVLQQHGVGRVVMVGAVSRRRLIDGGDALFRQVLDAGGDRRDQRVFNRVAAQIQTLGIVVTSPLEFVPDLVIPPGVLTRRAPSDNERADIQLGITVARTLAAVDVGQTVVLKAGVILAVEAAEGTDAAIRRGAQMAPGVVVVKVARPDQDLRFDLPTVGLQTVTLLRDIAAAALAVEAGKTLLLDREAAVAAADAAGIAMVGMELTRPEQPGFGVRGSGFGTA